MRRLAWVALLLAAVVGVVLWWRGRSAPPPSLPTAPPARPGEAPEPAPRRQVTVYFAQETPGADYSVSLSPVAREVPASSPAAEAALRALADGPTAEERARGLMPTLPAGTRLLGIQLEGGVATADFSQELQEGFSGGAEWEEVVLYSVVNTLTAIEGIRTVRIQVAGAATESIGGHVAADEPLGRNERIIVPGKPQ